MWIGFLYLSGALAWIGDNVPPLVYVVGPPAILFFKLARTCAHQRLEILHLRSALSDTTAALNHTRARIEESGYAGKIKAMA